MLFRVRFSANACLGLRLFREYRIQSVTCNLQLRPIVCPVISIRKRTSCLNTPFYLRLRSYHIAAVDMDAFTRDIGGIT